MCIYVPLLLSLQPSLEGRSIQAAPYHQGYQEDQVVLLALEVPMYTQKIDANNRIFFTICTVLMLIKRKIKETSHSDTFHNVPQCSD